MSIFEMFGYRPILMKNAEDEKSSGGVVTSDKSGTPELRLADGEIFLTDGLSSNHVRPENKVVIEEPERMAVVAAIKSKTEDVLKSVELGKKKEQNLQKGDVFENTETGETLFVEGEETRQGMSGIRYTETYPGGALKNEGRIIWRPLEGFRVLIRGEEMKKNDPIKEKYPEFYTAYGEQMTKADNAFAREFEANRVMMEAWEKFIDEEYSLDSLKKIDKDKKEKTEGEIMVGEFQFIREKIEEIGRAWKVLDDRIVEQGREELLLLAKLRSLEASLPDYALELKTSELRLLEKEHGTDEPDVELVEKGYQEILLERKKEAITERYNAVVDSSTVIAQDMPILNAFVEQINTLYLSINEESSSKDIRKVLGEIALIEKQMFVKKNKNNDENGEVVGGFVRNKKGNQREGGNGREGKGSTVSKRTTRSQGGIGTNEEESLVSSGAILQAEQDGKALSHEQRQTAFDTKKKIDEVIREKKLLAKGIFEDPGNIGKISKGKYKLHIGLLDDLGDSAKKPFRSVNIAELQAILEKVKGVEFRVEEFVAPKKVIETPVASASEKPKERTYEDLLKNLGRNEEESRKKSEVLQKTIGAGIMNIKNKIGEQKIRENKEKCVSAFVKVVKKHVSSTWTQSEQELFSQIFVERHFDDFVK